MNRSLTRRLLRCLPHAPTALFLLLSACAQDAQPPIACTGDPLCPPPSTLLRYAAQLFPGTTQRPQQDTLFAQEVPQLSFDAAGSALLRFDTGAQFGGSVRDGTGLLLPRAHVTAVLPSAIPGQTPYSFDTTTASAPQTGEFSLHVPVPSQAATTPYQIYIDFDDVLQAQSYTPLRQPQVITGDTYVMLHLPAPGQLGTVSGRITDSVGTGIGVMRVQVIDMNGNIVSTTALSSTVAPNMGSYQVFIDPSLTTDQKLRILAQPGSGSPMRASPILFRSIERPSPGATLQIDLPLPAYASTLRSVLLQIGGTAPSGAVMGVAGARVQAQAYLPDTALDQLGERALYTTSGVTDDQGRVSLDLLPASVQGTSLNYTVIVTSQASSPFASQVMAVPISDAPGTVTLPSLPLRAQLSGRLLSADGMPVPGAQVVARSISVDGRVASMLGGASLEVVLPQTTTDQDGRFALRLDQGDYDLDFVPVVGTQPRFSVVNEHILSDDVELGFINLPRPTLGKVQVLGPDGYPMRGASVRIFEVSDTRRQPVCVPLLPCSTAARLRAEVDTDSKGNAYFLLPDAPPLSP